MLVNRFPTLFLYLFNITSQLVIVSLRKCRSGSQNTHSHDHWTLASLSPRLLLSVFISSPFLSLLLLWILACHQEFCSTFPLPLPAVPLLLRLWDKKPNSVAQPAPSERFLFLWGERSCGQLALWKCNEECSLLSWRRDLGQWVSWIWRKQRAKKEEVTQEGTTQGKSKTEGNVFW